MAEQEAGRSEQPTPFKLDEARKKGMVVHSADVSALGMIIGFIVVVLIAAKSLYDALKLIFTFSFGPGLESSPIEAGRSLFDVAVHALSFPLLIIGITAFVSAFIQHPPLFSMEPLKPDWKKINPVDGLKRVFSLKSLYMLGIALFKVAVLSGICYFVFRGYLPEIAAAVGEPNALWPLLKHLSWAVLMTLLIVFFIFALLDFAINHRLYIKQMMMSKHEIKNESKRREGDPLIKRRIREYRMEMLKKIKGLGAVPGSDFVITNPTHYAVAIKYNPAIIDAPLVVAKGGGGLASRIRQIASRHRVPVYERKALTRALFFKTAVGQPVPVKYYRDIAILMKMAQKQRKKA